MGRFSKYHKGQVYRKNSIEQDYRSGALVPGRWREEWWERPVPEREKPRVSAGAERVRKAGPQQMVAPVWRYEYCGCREEASREGWFASGRHGRSRNAGQKALYQFVPAHSAGDRSRVAFARWQGLRRAI